MPCRRSPSRGLEPEFLGPRPPLLDCREGQQKVADVFLAREQEFAHHATHILQFDRYLSLLGENCLHAPRLAAAVREFEVGPLFVPGTRSQDAGVGMGMEGLHANRVVRPRGVGEERVTQQKGKPGTSRPGPSLTTPRALAMGRVLAAVLLSRERSTKQAGALKPSE